MNMANMNMNSLSSGHNTSNQLDRLSHENEQLKAQLADIRRQLRDRSHSSEQQSALNAIVQQMQVQNQWLMAQNMKQFMTPPHIPSPMSVPVPPTIAMGPMPPPPPIPVRPSMIPPGLPSSIPFNDRNGGHGIYTPKDGQMFWFPSKDSINGNNNKNKNKNTNNMLDVDQIVNNGQMNMDITMSSASLSDDSSTSNDNNMDKNKDPSQSMVSPTSLAQQPGIYGNSFPDCFCDHSPPSDIYHSEGTPDDVITPQTTSGSSSSWDTETQFPSSFRDTHTYIGSVGVGLGPSSSIPPPTYPPNHAYNHPFDDMNSVYGDHPAHI